MDHLTQFEIFAMSNVRGAKVKVTGRPLPFSFYFSTKEGMAHGIRVKPVFKPNKFTQSDAGVLLLHSNWEYIPNKNDKNVPARDIEEMKVFFRRYKVLFAAVWEFELPEDALQNFLTGNIYLPELLEEFYNYDEWKPFLSDVDSIESLEAAVREYGLFNMND